MRVNIDATLVAIFRIESVVLETLLGGRRRVVITQHCMIGLVGMNRMCMVPTVTRIGTCNGGICRF